MNPIHTQFFMSLLIIAGGYGLKRCNILQEQDGETLARIIFNVTLPCLIISTFSVITIEPSLLWLIVISALYGAGIALFGLYAFRGEHRTKRGMLAMLLPGFNIGLFAYPIVEATWGQEGLKYFGMFDVGNAFITFGVVYLIASHFSDDEVEFDFKNVLIKLSKSIPLVSYVAACVINFSGIQTPALLLDTFRLIAKANMPLSLLLLGIYLSFSLDSAHWKSVGQVLGIRYLTGLLVGAVVFFLLPFEPMFKYTLIVGLILPIAASTIAYSVEFEYDQQFVGTVSNITILASFFLIWIILSVMVH